MKNLKLLPVFIACSLFMCPLLESCSKGDYVDPLYDIVPNIYNYMPGSLSGIEQQKVLGYINSVRTTHNLPVVENDTLKNRHAQEMALYGVAKIDASDELDETSTNFPLNAAREYQNSINSLWLSATSMWPTSDVHIDDWLTELNSENINCRRRILDPFLKTVIFGRVIGTLKNNEFKYVSSAVLMTDTAKTNLTKYDISYIAYPQGIYSAKCFNPNSFLSFSVLYDKVVKSNNNDSNVDFSEAKVEVFAESEVMEIVEGSLSYDYNEYGLPNNLQWKVHGLTRNVTYTVKISGVKVTENVINYEYTFSFV
jgi:hypothetical protein